MSLRIKVGLVLSVLIILVACINYGILYRVVYSGFEDLEKMAAHKDLIRIIEAIQNEINHLDSVCHDWAAWNDTYDFILDKNSEYIEDNLAPSTFIDNEINVIFFFNTDGKVVWGEVWDLESEEKIFLDELPADALPPQNPLLSFPDPDQALEELTQSGIYPTSNGPLLVSSRPIITTDNEGPIRGTFVWGRFLDQSVVQKLSEQTRVEFKIRPVDNTSTSDKEQSLLKVSDAKDFTYEIKSVNKNVLQIFSHYNGLNGRPAIQICAEIPRLITAKGTMITRYATISLMIAGAGVTLVLMFLLQYMVLGPLERLTHHVIFIGKTNDLTKSMGIISHDEIGILSGEFNNMARKLSKARSELLEKSYYSGSADMISGILHNVRNILTPLMGQFTVLKKRIDLSPMDNVKKTIQELEEIKDPQRTQKLQRYLLLGSSQLIQLLNEVSNALTQFSQNANSIDTILAKQDQISRAERAVEVLRIHTLIHDALTLIPKTLKSSVSINLENNMQSLPTILGERTVLIQVISNIVINAIESIRRIGRTDGEISIGNDLHEIEEKCYVRLKICDNGAGIMNKDKDRIFERGFTTKKTKSSGIGLHWCCNVMETLDGKLSVESDGLEMGACFYLDIPVKEQIESHE